MSKFLILYGISQNPDSNDYILVQNYLILNRNENIDNFIQERQLNVNSYDDVVFEWIPYNQFNEIKETGKNSSVTVYSAEWSNGPLHYKKNRWGSNYTRDSNKEVTLKCLHNLQNPVDSLINEAKKYSTKNYNFHILYGVSQNPYTNNYILVQKYLTWTSGNVKIDNFIHARRDKISSFPDAIFEWIPYNQFNEIKEIGKGGFSTVYSAIWKDFKVALKCLDNSQHPANELLNEVEAYSTKMALSNSKIMNIYGISQDPNTKNYIVVLHYAEGGSFNNWLNINENYKYFNWKDKMQILRYIASGLRELHRKQIVHQDFHTGNILFGNLSSKQNSRIYISDMGLCRKVDDINQNNIYGVMPYVASEVLRGKPYTKAADIYSFGMIMYFVAAERQPFGNRAHDHHLALDICNGISPEMNELEMPITYIKLMNKCWDLNPENRPNINELDHSLSLIANNKLEIEKAEEYRKLHLSSLKGDRQITTHPQAI
ncbi:kinase-like domain-containing protein [Rhizophagus irregularis DAOM 181602=DAOM 197198]|uniref:Kinase-like domain-containing protein n=1 Tax=Rhizophagus irregularis (strain DAOM 181602 / DAOM 197198 / MUCL 43194) TaxID=747089 RepID=A0A2P4P587_RHIID|nr:kinase-like domain-containing protein [Rhizophagus irregularis DAOM 181602=DAOM 197198]POG60527.1 kinase-like domain-containing protein [Rhizophagus irregularis DAOM 181602=DAOM 197198]|eukprot:XP_025167393.1 kinase-like domain-containing protein [Rhizophagus irregularis DAOM 181602=DAOM 197198]